MFECSLSAASAILGINWDVCGLWHQTTGHPTLLAAKSGPTITPLEGGWKGFWPGPDYVTVFARLKPSLKTRVEQAGMAASRPHWTHFVINCPLSSARA